MNMTRTARRGKKQQALAATPWAELKPTPDLEGHDHRDDERAGKNQKKSATSRLLKARKGDLKRTKKTKLKGISLKKALKKLLSKRKIKKVALGERAPLLDDDQSDENTSQDSGVETATLMETSTELELLAVSKKEKPDKRKVKKSTRFTEESTGLLESSSSASSDESEFKKQQRRKKKRRIDDNNDVCIPTKKAKSRSGVTTSEEQVQVSERKREARRLRRQKYKVCFNCRQPGHQVSECPGVHTGICFKCGAADHTSKQCKAKVPTGEYPYAKCFICGEIGHVSKSCPDNPRGLYPKGGGCKVCGSVEHKKADCPDKLKQPQKSHGIAGIVIKNESADAEEFETVPLLKSSPRPKKTKHKVVTF